MIDTTLIGKIKNANPFPELLEELCPSLGTGQRTNCPTGHESASGACFSVYRDHGHCYHCGWHGDAIDLVMLVKKIGFSEAVRILARRGEVDLPSEAVAEIEAAEKQRVEHGRVYLTLRKFSDLAHENLIENQPPEISDWNYGDDVILNFSVGLVYDGIQADMAEAGYLRDDMIRAGLVNANGNPNLAGRIIFPVILNGRVVQIIGRKRADDTEPENPKYLLLPSHSEKHPDVSDAVIPRPCFNADAAEQAETILVVEGPRDVLRAATLGYSAVALMGCKPSVNQPGIEKLARAKKVVIVPDKDPAGWNSLPDIIMVLRKIGIRPLVAQLPDTPDGSKSDLDSWGRGKTDANLNALIASAQDGVSVLLENIFPTDATASAVMAAMEDAFPRLLDYFDPTELEMAMMSFVETQLSNTIQKSHYPYLKRKFKEIVKHYEKSQEQKAFLARMSAQGPPEMTPAEKEEAKTLLKDPRLLEIVAKTQARLGLVGEQETGILIYLVATSRKMSRPLVIIIIAPSSSGKSYSVKIVTRLVPQEDIISLTSVTPKAFVYMEEDRLNHSWVIVAEKPGSEEADYSVRIMQSEGELSVAYAGKDPVSGDIVTRVRKIQARVAYTETTTDTDINPENATRAMILTTDTSETQTRAIIEHQAKSATLDGLKSDTEINDLVKKLQNAQRLLRENLEVVIPYADLIRFSSKRLRCRRDFQQFLEVIKTVAFLHQYQRDIKTMTEGGKTVEYVEATVADYAIAYQLVCDVFRQTEDDLAPPVRQLYEAIKKYVDETAVKKNSLPTEVMFTRKDLVGKTGFDQKGVDKYILPLHHTYLEYTQKGRGGQYQYRLLPEEAQNDNDITTPEELAELLGIEKPANAAPNAVSENDVVVVDNPPAVETEEQDDAA